MIYFRAKPTLLRHVFDLLPEEEREEFFQTSEEFSSGLDATIEGARNYLRRTEQEFAQLHEHALADGPQTITRSLGCNRGGRRRDVPARHQRRSSCLTAVACPIRTSSDGNISPASQALKAAAVVLFIASLRLGLPLHAAQRPRPERPRRQPSRRAALHRVLGLLARVDGLAGRWPCPRRRAPRGAVGSAHARRAGLLRRSRLLPFQGQS